MTWAHRIGLRWSRWQLRTCGLYTVDIRTALSLGGKAVVCLPERKELLSAALEVSRRLSEWFYPLHLIVLSPSKYPPDLTEVGFPALVIPQAISMWGLPYKPIIHRVRKLAPRVAVDLHPEFHLASAHLCVQSGAALRIGFRALHDGYFNLHYTWKDGDGTDASDHFRNFLEMLADLRSSAIG